ncbi:Stem-specific protein TSJT1 [Camellia lanceoleosa]|uniref:Stem-specific protein TSJT1 n=1 Tax=Camellia lanceoleosa TaxID=1840588 RepID=A0ACC0IJ09_9ERIC|nr:Stem-specific protein TSJT1 [Camellia lanceoleosa]
MPCGSLHFIENARTLRDRGPYPTDQVLRDRKFAFILYDSSSKTTFVAAISVSVPSSGQIFGGNIELSDDVEIVKKGCCKSLTPFPKGWSSNIIDGNAAK